MARKGSSRRSRNRNIRRARRDSRYHIASLLPRPRVIVSRPYRRLMRPTVLPPRRPFKTKRPIHARAYWKQRRFKAKMLSLTNPVNFTLTPEALICARRKVREEVLHALRLTGSGQARQRKPRYNQRSKVRC